MNIKENTENGNITLALKGRLDTTTAPQLQEVLMPAFEEANQIVLDFKELAYVSSAGLRVLLMAQKKAKAGNSTMTLVNVSPDIMEVLAMTGFSNMLAIV